MMKAKIMFKHFEKSHLYCLISSLLVLLLCNLTLYAQISHSVNFPRSELKINDTKDKDGVEYQKVDLYGLQYTNEISKPSLPVRYVKLIIPSDQDVVKVIITNTQKETISLSGKIYPTQPDIPTFKDFGRSEFVGPDAQVYESDAPWPEEMVKVVDHGYFDGSNHIVTLAVCPFQYYPKENRLEFMTFILFNLNMGTTRQSIIQVTERSQKNQMIYDQILKNLVDNPQDISNYQMSASFKKSNTIMSGSLPYYEYVIITSNALKPYFDNFMEWKRRKGLEIGVVTTEEIFSNYYGDVISGIYDNAGKVRQYLYEAYQSGTIWALLAGDHTIDLVRYGCGANNYWTHPVYKFPNDYKIPADLYFADFNGDWNVDEDIYTGEKDDDDPDYNPEIFVGRLPCTSGYDVNNWTQKSLKYEQNPGNGNFSYLTKSFIIQSDQIQQLNQATYIKNHLPSAFYNNTEIWEELPSYYAPDPYFPTGAQVITEMNNLYGLYSWLAHGGTVATVAKTDSVNTQPRYVINTVDSYDNEVPESGNGLDCLTNNNYPSVLYSIACDNLGFDDYDPMGWWPGRCLGEGFTVNTEAGGPAFLGNTRYGWITSSYKLYGEFADLITDGTNDPESGKSYLHLGVAELISKDNFYGHYLRYAHNLAGCPETKIWTNTPSQFSNVTVSDNGSSITVNSGTSGCDICASSGNKGASYHLVVSDVSSYTFPTSVRPLYITITKSNYIPYTAVTGGTFTSDEVWFGEISVLGNVTVSGAATLNIIPGTSMCFKNNSSLNIYGNLTANGTINDRVTFDFTSISSSNGIKFQSGSSGTLNCCNIKNAYYGVRYTSNCSPTIQNCNITNNRYGIFLTNTGTIGNLISYNYISSNEYYGIYLYKSSPLNVNNNVIVNDRIGIYCYKSSPELYGNLISSNDLYGVYCYNNSGPTLFSNTVENSNYGVCCEYYNQAYLGYVYGEGHNIIRGNDFNMTGRCNDNIFAGLYSTPSGLNSFYGEEIYNVYAVYNTHIMAEKNWWGNPTYPYNPVNVYISSGGTLDWSPALDHDPNGSMMKVFSSNNNLTADEVLTSGKNTQGISDANSFFDSGLREALIKMLKGEYEAAIDQYAQRFKEEKDQEKKRYVLIQLAECYQKAGKSGFRDLLNYAFRPDISREDDLYATTLELENFILLNDGNYREAIDNYITLKTDFADNEAIHKHALFNLGYLHYMALNDDTKGQEYFTEFTETYPDDDLSLIAYEAMGKSVDWSREKRQYKPETSEIVVPAEYTLLGNYPNPFNPSTNIEFDLPKTCEVTLKIFNILGEEVTTLVSDRLSAGSYSYEWDASDMASGVYLYRLEAGEYIETRKMVMMR